MCYERVSDGVKLTVKVVPAASSNQIKSDGKGELKILVTAAPEDGKANKAVVRLLAKTFKISKSSIVLTHGETARLKTFLLSGNADEISAKINGVLSL